MKCPEVRQKLYLFLDNELKVEDNLEILTHLDFCADCSASFESEKQIEELLKEKSSQGTPPEDLWKHIRSHIDGSPSPSPWNLLLGRKIWIAGSALAATLILGAGALYYLTTPAKANADTLVNQSIQLHQQILKGKIPTDVPQEIQNDFEKTRAFLSQRAGTYVCCHNLSKLGYAPERACMAPYDPPSHRHVALVIYDRGHERLSHFILKDPQITFPQSAFRQVPGTHKRYYLFVVRPYKVIIFRNGKNLCLFVGHLNHNQITDLVRVAAQEVLSD